MRHIRQESLDHQIRSYSDDRGDGSDIDTRMARLLDERDRWQLKLEDVEIKAEFLESSKQEVRDAGGEWSSSHERKYQKKAQKYASRVDIARKQLEYIDEQIAVHNGLDSASRRKNRFSVSSGGVRHIASGISATGAGLRRRMFGDDNKGGAEGEADAGGAATPGHAKSLPARVTPYKSQQVVRGSTTGSIDLGYGYDANGDVVRTQPKTTTTPKLSVDDVLVTQDVASMGGSASVTAETEKGPGSRAAVPKSLHESVSAGSLASRLSTVTAVSASTSIAGSRRGRFTFFSGRDKASHGSLASGSSPVAEIEAISELVASIRMVQNKAEEAHGVSASSMDAREKQADRLRALELQLKDRDTEMAALKELLAKYETKIEKMVISYQKHLQDDVHHVEEQVSQERDKLDKIKIEMEKYYDKVVDVERRAQDRIQLQEGMLSMLTKRKPAFEALFESVFGSSENIDKVYFVTIILFTLLILTFVS